MSVENLKKFGQMCAEDEEVRQKTKDIGIQNLEGLMAYGKELGLEFSAEDMQAVAGEAGVTQDELSDEQLEQIAGGAATMTALIIGGLAAIGAVVTTTAGAGAAVGLNKHGW